jgi:hypothetical protein
VDGAGRVGGSDWLRYLAAFGASAGSPHYDPQLDQGGDGLIGVPDLLFAARSLGRRAGPSGVACGGWLGCYAR